jgi:hypothetical protein
MKRAFIVVYTAVRATVVNHCLFNLIFTRSHTWRWRVIQPCPGHITRSAHVIIDLASFTNFYLFVLDAGQMKQKNNLRGNWQEDLQNSMRTVRTNLLPSITKSREGFLERIWLKISTVSLNWGGKLYFHQSRNKSFPRELLG